MKRKDKRRQQGQKEGRAKDKIDGNPTQKVGRNREIGREEEREGKQDNKKQ